jgi:hypothetical protein
MTGRWTAVSGLLALCLGLAAPAALAQVQVSARLDADQVAVGHTVRMTISVSGADREITPPQFPSVPGLDAYGAGQSQRFSFVNGQSRAEYSWSWSLVPRREGEVKIPAIKVSVDGKVYQTSPQKLVVVAASAPPPPTATPDDRGGSNEVPDAFVTMRVDQDSVVVGEQLILTFGFYRASRTSMFESPEYTAPRSEGFWREDLPPERHRRELIRSRRYEVTEIQYALFPTRAGNLEISEATVRLPDDAFGSFFRRSSRRRGPSVLRTEPITIHVRPLPSPVPADFSGTVATDLRLHSSVDRRTLEQGDALTWRIRLEGTGHLDAVRMPVPELGAELTVHESATSSASAPDAGKLQGSRTVEYLVIPQQPGELVIPGLDYSYYDVRRQEYARARTEAIVLRVTPSEGSTSSVFTGGRKSEIELLARDILYIETVGDDEASWPGPLPRRRVFWTLVAGMPMVWALSAGLSRRRRTLLADPRLRRSRAARAKARRVLGSTGSVDERVPCAVEGYLADRFDRAASGLVRDEVQAILLRHAVSPDLVAATTDLLDRCDAARYAPSTATDESLVEEARRLIDRLEEEFDAR